jgi:hypothetical protein
MLSSASRRMLHCCSSSSWAPFNVELVFFERRLCRPVFLSLQAGENLGEPTELGGDLLEVDPDEVAEL